LGFLYLLGGYGISCGSHSLYPSYNLLEEERGIVVLQIVPYFRRRANQLFVLADCG